MVNTRGIHVGMVVHSADGHRLGRVVAVGEEQFQIEKGLFFPQEYLAAYSDIRRVEGHDVRLVQGRDQLTSSELDIDKGMQPSDGGGLGELGRARMERYHDVIGAAPIASSDVRPALHAAEDHDKGDVVRHIGLLQDDEPVRQ